jgi:three-Cys-motif partner protein
MAALGMKCRAEGSDAERMGDEYEYENEEAELDVASVGQWARKKHEMLEYYAGVYSQITRSGSARLKRFFVDGFASTGYARIRGTDDIEAGSPIRALAVEPPFDGFFFVESDAESARKLRLAVGNCEDVQVLEGDINRVLPDAILPTIRFDRRERALIFLDPYNLGNLKWSTVDLVAKSGLSDLILHFPTMDANRNVLWADPSKVSDYNKQRMNEFWGDGSWHDSAYTTSGLLPIPGLFRKAPIDSVLEAYRKRLLASGFKVVGLPIPVRNTRGRIIYHIFLASPNETAKSLITSSVKKFRA